jgi:hypothetical protein
MAVTMKNAVFWDVTPCGSLRTDETSDKTAFFIVAAVKTSNLTWLTVTSPYPYGP